MHQHFGKVIICIFMFFISGCVTIENLDSLLALKRLGASQREIEVYLRKQEKLFYKLVNDVKSNKLKKGVSKQRIVSIYGEPILAKTENSKVKGGEFFLYRHPTKYFSSDRIYLYFDTRRKLSYWEYKPSLDERRGE